MDDNGSPAALLIVKFRNMLPEESRKFVTYFSAGCNKAAEEFPAADKHPEAYWLYVTAGDLIEITFNNPGHGACKVGPFKLEEKKIYEIVLENEKMQDISFNSIPGGATVMLDGEYVGVTPCEKKQATYGKHTVALTLDGLTKEEEIKPLLEKQVSSSVRWQQTIERLIADGADKFVEIGPGKTLTGFMRKINRDVAAVNIDKYEDFEKFVAESKNK